MISILLILLANLALHVSAQAQTFWPASIPLAIRSPYMNCWMNIPNGSHPLNLWPTIWDGGHIFGWAGYVKVDDTPLQWLGMGGPTTNLTQTYITPTRTIFTVQAGPSVQLNVTFMNPIEPSDWVLQSLPFAYLAVDVMSTDGKPHSVKLYSDISAEWVSGDLGSVVKAELSQTASSVFFQMQRTNMSHMQEINNVAEDSTVYFGMASRPGLTWESSQDPRTPFANNGKLGNTQDQSPHQVNENDKWILTGISVNLDNITSTSSPVVWGIGLIRDPIVQFVDANGNAQNRTSYFWSKYNNIGDAVDTFLRDFPNAFSRAVALDQKIMSDSASISPDYSDLVSLGTRQAVGGLDITIARRQDGTVDPSDVKIFMKDTGNTHRVNPVEAIYASMPMLLYHNASLLGGLLEPLLQYQSSPAYKNPYAAPDLGSTYPIAPGNNGDASARGIEDSGSMLILALAHAKFSGDGSLLNTHYPLLKTWANYLVQNSLVPATQTTSENENMGNLTNLAIKGIIGIRAMADISDALGHKDEAVQYRANASSLVSQWRTMAQPSDHLLLSYQDASSWGLIYNLYPDKLLQTNLVDSSVYTSQTAFYKNQTSASSSKFGLPFASDASGVGRSDWTLFTASTVSDDSVRNTLISMVHSRVSNNQTTGSFPTTYDVNSGSATSSRGSPAQGAMYAPLALKLQSKTIQVPVNGGSSPSPNGSSKVGPIVGGVVGGILFLSVLILGVFVWRRRRSHGHVKAANPVMHDVSSNSAMELIAEPFPATLGPQQTESNQRVSEKHRTPVTLTWTGAESSAAVSDRSEQTRHWGGSTTALLSPSSDYSLHPPTESSLRTEVENLRREVELLRAGREYDEPPPEY